jgi:hypothetical protein
MTASTASNRKSRKSAGGQSPLKTVINFIDRNGPSTLAQLKGLLRISESAIYFACLKGQEEGYLTLEMEKKVGVRGRRHAVYHRTAKHYGHLAVAEITPFRHPDDIALFGAYAKPFEPTMTTGRIYRQEMTVTDDELECAA